MTNTLNFVDEIFESKYTVTNKKSRKERREKNKHQSQAQKSANVLNLKEITPKTINQKNVFKSYGYGNNIVCHGSAGTGKTYITMYLALQDILYNENFKKLIIIRSAVQGRQIGFLPGSDKEKMAVYEEPYKAICADLMQNKSAYDLLKAKGQLFFESSSFLRGMTFDDSIILLDEAQNFTTQELETVITRIGVNSKIIICGDTKQNDLVQSKYDVSGLYEVMKIFQRMKSVDIIEFNVNDIVRSGFVKEFLIAKESLNI